MKQNIIKITVYLVTALPLGGVGGGLLLTSCADLEQTSLSSIDKDNFYQSKEDIETAINGIYQEFTVDGFYGMFNNQSVYINDLQTDYVKAGAQTNSAHIRELSNFAVQPTNLFVSYAWEEHYKAINRANVVIDKVGNASFLDEQTRQNYINEARFLRGFMYFNLVRYFGGVPIVLHDGEGEGAPRNSIDEVYHQIVDDLSAGEQLPVGYTMQLTANVEPKWISYTPVITWTSSDSTILRVSQTGFIEAVGAGTATLTARDTISGKYVNATVTVYEIEVNYISVSPSWMDLGKGQTGQFTVTFNPENATNKTITWTSANPSLVTVDSTGFVTAFAAGAIVHSPEYGADETGSVSQT